MRVIVVGGTRFVGRAVVTELVDAGHDVLVVHRGEHEPTGLPATEHLHTHRRDLGAHRARLADFRPDGLIDLCAMTAADAHALLDAVPDDVRLVVASSLDVHRAFAALWAGKTTDPVPLTEHAPLRTEAPPDAVRGATLPGWDVDMAAYEKLDVERAFLARAGTVCRLPFVYGEHDYQRREEFVLRRVRARRRRMPFGPGTFLGSRGYAPELARGLRLAVEAQHAGTVTGEVITLCEATCASMRLWAEQIVVAAGAELELVTVPSAALPPDLAPTGDVSQHLLADPGTARELLGWVHRAPLPLVERSVAWHLAHPPDADDPAAAAENFAADDAALAHQA